MKPVYLEFCGVNSFSEPAKIDFKALLQNGVFGIFGDTGSGKSTVLDSIHFALYGEIDRAPKAFNDCINYRSDGAFVVFDFEITTDGVRRTYRVRRERKRKAGSTKAFLYEYNEAGGLNALAEGTREVDEAIERIVGLTFSDFKTCIALPQGDFAALVKSTTAERVKLVARLFDLEKYGERLSKAVNEKYYRAEEEVNLLKARMSENEGGRVELIDQTRSQLEAQKSLLAKALEELERAEKEEKLAETQANGKREYDALKAKLQAMEARLTGVQKTRALLERLPKAEAVVAQAKRLDGARSELAKAEREARAAKAEHERAAAEAERRKSELALAGYEEKILALSLNLQKLLDASAEVEAAERAEREVNACRQEYLALKKSCIAEDFEGERARLEKEIAALGEDDTLLDYLKRNYKAVLLADTYGEFRADLSALSEKYPQTHEDVARLLQKYAAPAKNDPQTLDIAQVNLAFRQLEQKKKFLKGRLEETEKRSRAFQETQSKLSALIERGKILQKTYGEALQKIAFVKDMGTAEEVQKQLSALKNAQAQARVSLEAAQARASESFARLQKQEALEAQLSATVQAEAAQLQSSLSENGFSSAEEASALVSSLPDPARAARETQAFFDEYGACAHKYESIDKQAFDDFDESRLPRARSVKAEAQALVNGYHKSVGALTTTLERLTALAEKFKEQAKELAKKEEAQKLCDELRQLVKSNKFLEFIASEYLQEISFSASKTLLSLTGGRYFLQYDKEFKVGDNLDGGSFRAVKTLSGGETFLVSLSLALALSTAICLKSLRPIEFFFLDEGFGTLDEKLVDTVMDVLGKLSKSFSVGLISHVEELKRRVESKIVVTGANERHGSQIRTEIL